MMADKKTTFAIPPEHIRYFGKALQVLAKLGEEIYIESVVKSNDLSFRTANQSRSSYSCISFKQQFFQDNRQENLRNAKIKCRISAKRCTSAVQAILSSKPQKLELVFDNFKGSLSFILHCRYDIIKVHSCLYIDCEKLQARFDKQSYKNCVSIMSKTLQELTAHFPIKWDEITIHADQEQFLIRKCDEILHDDENIAVAMNFQITCGPREFIKYDVQYESDITFCLRELKFLLGLSDLLNLPMTLFFDSRGRPIIFCFDADELHFDGTFVFATIADEENESELYNRTSQSTANETLTMEVDDLVPVRKHTLNRVNVDLEEDKQPERSSADTFLNSEYNMLTHSRQLMNVVQQKPPTAKELADTTYTQISQRSMVGLQQSEDFEGDFGDDDDAIYEEN